MNLASVMRSEAALLLPTYERNPVLFVRGRGVHIWDASGRCYLDFLSGIGVNALGYNHPAIQKVLARQSTRLIHVSNLFYHEYQAELAERLTRLSGMDRAFFCNSGTEAWEGALKLARAYAHAQNHNGHKAKWRILALENSFHGRTFGSLATTGQPKYRKPFAPLMPGVSFVELNDLDDLNRQFDASVCAICFETIQGEGGVWPISQQFLEMAYKLSRKGKALLIADEIQCGLGRTGKAFAYEHYGVRPDIVTVAKPLAAGLPLGGILTTHAVAQSMTPGLHGTTFGGGPLSCAVAVEFVEQMQRLLPHVQRIGSYFEGKLQHLATKHESIREVRGIGLMLAVDLDSRELAKFVVQELLNEGILINHTHDTVLRFLPPYIIREEHVDEVVAALDSSLLKGADQSQSSTSESPRQRKKPARSRT